MATRLMTLVYVLGLLICGSLNTITMKIAFTMSGVDLQGEERTFQKPWFITFVMFVGMSLALAFDRQMWKSNSAMQKPLIDGPEKSVPWSKKVVMVSIPAVFDILATGLCSMGFLYIPASVWQLLRGAEMVFAALLAVLVLRKKLFVFHWLAVALCVSGIVLVGLASVWGAAESQEKGGVASGGRGATTLLVGMTLALLGQVVQAGQVIAEEWLLTDVDLPGLQIVGFEGMWGVLIMLALVFPALYLLPGNDGGHLENEADDFVMVGSNQALTSIILINTLSCATYNMAGIAVTGALSAVHRVMLEAFRTSIVWIFGLTVHYAYDSASPMGEVWTSYSYLEVLGFLVLMLGQSIYGEILRVPGLFYPKASKAVEFASPGGMRNLVAPFPQEREQQ